VSDLIIWQKSVYPYVETYIGQPVAVHLQVRLGVWPPGPGHQAGVVWTVNGWQTVYTTPATFQGQGPNPYGGWDELWEAWLQASPTFPVRFWYATWAQAPGRPAVWDNNDGLNYEYVVWSP
jgi:hypothetical protein